MLKLICITLLTTSVWAVSEFEEFVEHEIFVEAFDEVSQKKEESVVVTIQEEIIEDFLEEPEFLGLPEEICALFQEEVTRGSTVIDFGETSKTSKLLSSLVGPFGKVLSFDMKEALSALQSANIEIHPVDLEEIDVDLNAIEVDNLVFIKVDAWGYEDEVLKKASKLIAKDHPTLLINMLGGIPLEKADRYVKEEFQDRMEQIKRLGYAILRLNDTFYVAKNNN